MSGEGIYNIYNYDVFTWKIRNFSSIPHEVDLPVQSPSFCVGGAYFILKLYPNGQTFFNSKGYIDLIIERFRPLTGDHRVLATIRYINIANGQSVTKGGNYLFETGWNYAKVPRLTQNQRRGGKYPSNDVFSITFTFAIKYTPEKKSTPKNDSEPTQKTNQSADSDSAQSAEGKLQEHGNTVCQEVGEIVKEYLAGLNFKWGEKGGVQVKLSDSEIKSEPFSFGGASWILQLNLHFLKKKSSEEWSYDMILKRLHTEIDQHNVLVSIRYGSSGNILEKSYCFDANQTRKKLVTIPFTENTRPNSRIEIPTIDFDIKMKIDSDWPKELNEELSEDIPQENTDSSESEFEELSTDILQENTESSASENEGISESIERRNSEERLLSEIEELLQENAESSSSESEGMSEYIRRINPEQSASEIEELLQNILRRNQELSVSETRGTSELIERRNSEERLLSEIEELLQNILRRNQELSVSETRGEERITRTTPVRQTYEALFYFVFGFLFGLFVNSMYTGYKK